MVLRPKDQYPGDLVDTIPVAARADLTDVQWAVLAPLLPEGRKQGPPAEVDQAAAHRRYSLANTGGLTVAGRAPAVRTLADGVSCTACIAVGSATGPGCRS